jgi:hypothetical protein
MFDVNSLPQEIKTICKVEVRFDVVKNAYTVYYNQYVNTCVRPKTTLTLVSTDGNFARYQVTSIQSTRAKYGDARIGELVDIPIDIMHKFIEYP